MKILMYVYVAPPTLVGTWLLGLRQRIEYYYYEVCASVCVCKFNPTGKMFLHLDNKPSDLIIILR